MVRGGVQEGERLLNRHDVDACRLSSCYVTVGLEHRPMPSELRLPRVDPGRPIG